MGRSPMSEGRPSTVGQSHDRTSGGAAAITDSFERDGGGDPTLPTGPRRPRVSLSPRLILWLIVAVVLLYGVIYPNLHVVIASLQRDSSWSLTNFREVLSQSIVLESIFASVGISALTVLFCASVGIPLAFLFERYTFPARRLFATFAALPLVLPPLVAPLPSFFSAANPASSRAWSSPSFISKTRPGHCVGGRRYCFFIPTRCIRSFTY
jgi:hypothetical protein